MHLSERARALRAAYDRQLRGHAEVGSHADATSDGPLWRTTFGPDYGFVSYTCLDDLDGSALDALITRTIEHFRDSTAVREFEWKTRGHDQPADLAERLIAHGFTPQEVETVMIGEVSMLAEDRPLPDGITLRRIGRDVDGSPHGDDRVIQDVTRMLEMQDAVFNQPSHQDPAELSTSLIAQSELKEAWVAEADGAVVCAGRLEIVPGTEFAGLWGGATREEWRGRGIYRALTAARARSAQAKGVHYLHSDSTAYSRPILERSGFLAVTTTTPFIWHRTRPHDEGTS